VAHNALPSSLTAFYIVRLQYTHFFISYIATLDLFTVFLFSEVTEKTVVAVGHGASLTPDLCPVIVC
jgi:hypothetical protein